MSPRTPTVRPMRRPAAEDPAFLAARDEWDNRLSNLALGKRNWQVMAAALLLLVFLLSAALFWLSSQTKITPYVVEVDKLGQPVAFGPADQLHSLDERLYRYLLSVFIYNVRSTITDPLAQKTLLTRAYAYTAKDASAFLDSYFRAHNPFERAQEESVAVQVHTILRLSEKTWQVQWTETHRSLTSQAQSEEHWQAALSTELSRPAKVDAILQNPVGLFVTAISWTKTQ